MTDTTLAEPTEHHVHDGSEDFTHEMMYIKVAIGLAVLTAMEISWPYIVDDGPILMVPLLIMMVIKFGIIAAFFMHLKFDSKLLTRVFYAGLFLAVAVYAVALMTFEVFSNGG